MTSVRSSRRSRFWAGSPPSSATDVLDRSDAVSLLAQLEHSNLFLQRLERGGWFRVHSLFAEFAVARLASVEPGAARADPRESGRLVQVARVGGRSDRARGRGGRPRDRGGAARRVSPAPDPERGDAHSPPLGSHAARRPASRLIRSSRPPRRRPPCSSVTARSSSAASCSSPRRALADEPERLRGCRGAHGARGHDRRRRRPGGARRPPRRRARSGGCRRAPHRRLDRLRARALFRGRPRRGVGGCAAGPRASRCRAPSAQPRGRPLDARARRGRARTARCRSRPRREGEGDRRAESARAEAGSARTRPPRSAPCWRARASSRRPSTSSPTRSTSSETRWRPSTTPGCSSCSPASVCAAAVSTRQ